MPDAFSSPSPNLTVSLDGAVATIAVHNPAKRNAFDLGMWQALPAIMRALEANERVRVVLLRGKGTSPFASGADIAEFGTVRADAAGSRAYEAANEAAFWAVAQCPKPVIAMIRGVCLGGGFGLAAACDLRIVSRDAVFGIPAARLGIGYPPGAMRLITALVGPAVAKDLFLTARRFGADEALRLGIAWDVVPDARLEGETRALTRTVAENAPLTIRAAKAAIDHAAGIARAGTDPQALADACFDSADFLEGRRAFLDKRPPVFRGR